MIMVHLCLAQSVFKAAPMEIRLAFSKLYHHQYSL